jgi:hypothetical protein
MLTFGDFKTAIRGRIFVTGEAPNLRAAHDKSFLDAIIEIQKFVECIQEGNTTLVNQCSTVFDCGLTRLDAPRGNIKKVSVVNNANASGGGIDIPAGTYVVQYTAGAWRVDATQWLTAKSQDKNIGCYIKSGNSRTDFDLPGTSFPSFEAAIASVNFPVSVTIEHPGGDFGIYFNDTRLDDNANGTPSPTFSLLKDGKVLSTVTIDAFTPGIYKFTAPAVESGWCSEIVYKQIDPCHIHKFRAKGASIVPGGCCGGWNPYVFFGLFDVCNSKNVFPPPTGAGVPDFPSSRLG